VGYWKREDLFGTGEDDDDGGSDTGGGGGGSDTGGGGGGSAALASLGESCSVKMCESPLVCDEYSMTCGHAPVTPPPPFGDSSINYTSLSQATLDSIGSGWTQIKYLPGTSTKWFPGNDKLLEYPGTEFLFTTGDFSRWLVCDQSEVNGEFYLNSPRTIKKSSISAIPYQARWYNRDGVIEDPWVSLEDHFVSIVSNTVMYGNENNDTDHPASIHSTGMYVFVR
jgi:hypothetical protein